MRFNKSVSIHYEKNGPFATNLATGFSSCIGHLQLGVFCNPLILMDKLHESHTLDHIQKQYMCNSMQLSTTKKQLHATWDFSPKSIDV